MAVDSGFMLYFLFFINLLSYCNLASCEEVVTCRLGQTCVLPCSFQGKLHEVHWTRKPWDYKVLTFVDHRTLSDQHPLYTDRTSLSENLSSGNASLLLSQVTVKDQGRFRCFTSSSRGHQSHSLKLTVFAPVLQVSVEQEGQQLLCRSEGVYPQPTVVWTPSTEHNTTVTSSETGLFSVLSSVPLTQRPPQEYSCYVSTAHSWRSATYWTGELDSLSVKHLTPAQTGVYTCHLHAENQTYTVHIEIKECSILGFLWTAFTYASYVFVAIVGPWALFQNVRIVPQEIKLHRWLNQEPTKDVLTRQKKMLKLTLRETEQINTVREMLRKEKCITVWQPIPAKVFSAGPEMEGPLDQTGATNDGRTTKILLHVHFKSESD